MAVEHWDRSAQSPSARRDAAPWARKRPQPDLRKSVGVLSRLKETLRLPRTDGRLRDPELDQSLLRELEASPDER